MTRLYLIRHCEAEGNIYRRCQGWYDSRITPNGARQIEALAERFRSEPIDALYSSDLTRTKRTAGAILKYHELELQTDPWLREMRIGVWEDRPFGDLGWEYPEQMYCFNNDPAHFQVEGAESFEELRRRITAALTDILRRNPDRTVAVVSHGVAIRAFLSGVLGLPSERIGELPHGDNTAVSLLEYEDGRFRAVYMNDAGHLPPELSTFSRQSWWREPEKPDPNNIHFVRLDPGKEPETYLGYYRKTWQAVHGDLRGFEPKLYLEAAEKHVRACPDALVTMVRPDGTPVGVTELDTERGRCYGSGWICLCFVEEAWRRNMLGVQLIGHAVSLFRGLGRRSLRLNVFEGNTAALRFYEANEFRPVGVTDGVDGKLYIMEKEL